ncbi:MAG: hypothetical protein HOQ05_04650 [Corynebacteriales bacterium]|nr:hypothetical protein [Mycobacteriales bacterium]
MQSTDVQVQAGATGAGTGCVVEECEPGQQNFTRTRFERTAVDAPVAVTGFENAGCQGPAGGGVSVDELAVREFFSTKITVDPPKMQPDTGVLLVNMPNNFFCTTPKQFEMDSSITINGGVRFRLTVDELVFDYGVDNRDSAGSRHDRFDRTDRLGKAIDPEVLDRIDTREELRKASEVWHEYWQTGTFDVLVTVYFTGEYSVGGGAWQPITGSIYATSASRQVQVFQTRAELIDPQNQ